MNLIERNRSTIFHHSNVIPSSTPFIFDDYPFITFVSRFMSPHLFIVVTGHRKIEADLGSQTHAHPFTTSPESANSCPSWIPPWEGNAGKDEDTGIWNSHQCYSSNHTWHPRKPVPDHHLVHRNRSQLRRLGSINDTHSPRPLPSMLRIILPSL